MDGRSQERQDEQDWRLQAELELADSGGVLARLIARFRDPELVKEVQASVPSDVVITHDGRLLFAYASDADTLAGARRAIEAVLDSEHVGASLRVSRWDEDLDRWLQVEPPPSAAERASQSQAKRDAQTIQTRTLVVSSGRLVRGQLEQTMRDWAQRLGLECQLIEHPHLLSTQIAFTVTGPRGKLDEFARGLRAEELATIRTEGEVMASPL